MGQVNSQYSEASVCRYHCEICDCYFGTPGEEMQHRMEDKIHKKLSKGKAIEIAPKACKAFENKAGPSSYRRIEAAIPEYARPDNIWRCLSCKRFCYSEKELDEHVDIDHLKSDSISDKIRSESCFCAVCKRSYPCRLEDHTAHARLHNERPNISIKDRETERVQICCVRCGIYFLSTEAKRKHFRDVEHHNVRDKDPDSSTDSDDDGSFDWEDIGPELLPPIPVSISSAYAPEFSRRRASMYQPQPVAGPSGSGGGDSQSQDGSSSSKARVEVIDYECPLCLENDEIIAALPCGHIFGMQCIQDALASDSRCPLCRNYATERDVRQIYLTV